VRVVLAFDESSQPAQLPRLARNAEITQSENTAAEVMNQCLQ
jgi:hypothetical protein